MTTGSDPMFLEHVWENKPMSSAAPTCWNTPNFSTDSLSTAQQHLRAFDQSVDLKIGDPSAFESYRESKIRIGSIAVSVTSIRSYRGYDLSFRPSGEYCLNVPLKGRGWIANGPRFFDMDTEQAAFVSPHCDVHKHWSGSSQVLTLHVPASTFANEQRIAALATLPGVVGIARTRLRGLMGLVDLVCREANWSDAAINQQPVAHHIEQALLLMLFESLPIEPQSHHPHVPNGSGPLYLLKAEQYIRANFQNDFDVEHLARSTGTSCRSLQYAFRRYRNATPMQYIRNVRLDRAKTMLASNTGTAQRINEVAAEVGYLNPSQFSRLYRERFGESPTNTQARQASEFAFGYSDHALQSADAPGADYRQRKLP